MDANNIEKKYLANTLLQKEESQSSHKAWGMSAMLNQCHVDIDDKYKAKQNKTRGANAQMIHIHHTYRIFLLSCVLHDQPS